MNTQEVAEKVVEFCREQAWREAVDALYAKDIVSVEAFNPDGGPTEMRGIDAIYGKVDWWTKAMEVHDMQVSDPFVAHDHFVVQYDMDVTDRESNKRMQMSEVGVYTVKDGKIIHEMFLPKVGQMPG